MDAKKIYSASLLLSNTCERKEEGTVLDRGRKCDGGGEHKSLG